MFNRSHLFSSQSGGDWMIGKVEGTVCRGDFKNGSQTQNPDAW